MLVIGRVARSDAINYQSQLTILPESRTVHGAGKGALALLRLCISPYVLSHTIFQCRCRVFRVPHSSIIQCLTTNSTAYQHAVYRLAQHSG